MTTQECDTRDKRTIENIESMLRVHKQLGEHADSLEVSIEDAAIVVRGELPSDRLKSELIPAVRQAGVLDKVCNCVQVPA